MCEMQHVMEELWQVYRYDSIMMALKWHAIYTEKKYENVELYE